MKKYDIPKSAFVIQYDSYKFVVMLFEFTNAPSVFMDSMTHMFQ